jgi:phosphoribulokinase
MPDKQIRMARAGGPRSPGPRPVLLAIAGDSASGKTTLARGLAEAIGPERCTTICVDDYHRFDRAERAGLSITALHPDANYIDIMEQHLQMLATGQPILKPVYDHHSGTFTRPEYVQPRQFILVEGLLPLLTKLSRACFDISVFLDPPEELRRVWKLHRDTGRRGYRSDEVLSELRRRERESAEFIRPQRRHADIVVRFVPPEGHTGQPLSAELLLRPSIEHPPLNRVLSDDVHTAMNLTIIRDSDGTPVDCLQVHGHAAGEELHLLQKAIWSGVSDRREMPDGLGRLGPGERSEPLAVTQLLLLYHLLQEMYLA